MRSFNKLEERINYYYKDKNLLKLALTHSSYANEKRNKTNEYNERLEFLGDSVLGLIISEYVYNRYSDYTEGEMTKMRAKIVCENTLYEVASDIELGEYMLFGKGELLSGGKNRPSILADAFESLLASLYLDGGFAVVKEVIFKLMKEKISLAEKGLIVEDYKTYLQEYVQAKKNNYLKYELIEEAGPDHLKTFKTAVKINDEVYGIGEGRSKKESEQDAAKSAIRSGKLDKIL